MVVVRKFLILFLVGLMTIASASAATYTVGSGGDYSSIQSCVDAANPGDTCLVSAGTYDEKIDVSNSGIVLKTEGRVVVKRFRVFGNENTIKDFEITDSGSKAGIEVFGNNNLLEGNEIYHMGQDGIRFFGADNIYRNNFIHDILHPGFTGDPHADCFQTWGEFSDTTNALFENNICIHNRESGSNQIVMLERKHSYEVRDITFRNNIFVMDTPGFSRMNFNRKSGQLPIYNIVVENNHFIHRNGFGYDAIQFSNIDSGSVKNNIFYNYGDEERYVKKYNSDGITINNNLIYKTNGVPPNGGPYPNDLWMVDPQFVDFSSGDYRLAAESPACGAGEGGIDIGAFACGSGGGGPDLNGDGCIQVNEISVYVQLWLNGGVTLGDVNSAVNIWLQGC